MGERVIGQSDVPEHNTTILQLDGAVIHGAALIRFRAGFENSVSVRVAKITSVIMLVIWIVFAFETVLFHSVLIMVAEKVTRVLDSIKVRIADMALFVISFSTDLTVPDFAIAVIITGGTGKSPILTVRAGFAGVELIVVVSIAFKAAVIIAADCIAADASAECGPCRTTHRCRS